MRVWLFTGTLALITLLAGATAAQPHEQSPAASEPGTGEDDATTRARAAFLEGAAHATEMRWGDALARFEASAGLRRHAGTTYNIGICHRALGHYALARTTFQGALAEHHASGDSELAPSLVGNTEAYLKEIERVLAVLTVTLEPADAAIAVDGRPLQTAETGDVPHLIAGALPAGPGKPPPAGRFELVLDPGAHVFVLSREGHGDAVVRKTVAPGSRGELSLVLERLPARLNVRSNEPDATISVDGIDVGLAPVALERPSGRYHVLVQKQGFDPYETDVLLRPAEQVDLIAKLQAEETGLHERWWFWASIGAVVTSAAVVTYFVTRPEPEQPPLNGGGLGWAIRVP